MSKGCLAHAASLEQTGCWRWDKCSLTQNNMASAQPLLMSHFDLGTFLQYSCLQIRALTCTVEVYGDIGESDTCFQHSLQEQGVQVLQASASTYRASYSSGTSAEDGQIFPTSFFPPQKYLHPQMFPTQKLGEESEREYSVC